MVGGIQDGRRACTYVRGKNIDVLYNGGKLRAQAGQKSSLHAQRWLKTDAPSIARQNGRLSGILAKIMMLLETT